MKKSLIALAVMAAAGAASAQSSVQLYGIADVWFGSTETGVGAAKLKQIGLTDGGVDGSRFGLKGSEDLGGGLKAIFTLEQGFTLDDGKLMKDAAKIEQTGFNREATVGLQGNFGTVKLGKQFNAFDDVSGAAATVFDGALTPMNNVFESGAFASTDNNTVKYISPAFNGFTGSASYTFGEDKTATADATHNYALSGQYANGPLALGIGYAVTEKGPKPTWEGKATRLNGSYNFGVATLKASYGNVDYDDNWKTKEYEIGVDYPVASNLILSAGYASSKVDNAAGERDSNIKGFGVAAAYLLSKRTTAYVGATQATTENAAGVDTAKTTIYAVGVKHAF
jgi:predicted porin